MAEEMQPIESQSAEITSDSKEILRSSSNLSATKTFAAMFITRALEKIASDKETKRPTNTDLRNACKVGIEFLKSHGDSTNASEKNLSEGILPPYRSMDEPLLNDEKILFPFELACKSRSPKVVATALDCLQKLIAYGHVSNSEYDCSNKVRLIDRIVSTICSCFQGVNTDDSVQLQVIKALLTVITSPVVEVHEKDILLVIRTCYNIYMATRNLVNQTTARATLTQMLNVIFQKMEQFTFDAAIHHENSIRTSLTQVTGANSGHEANCSKSENTMEKTDNDAYNNNEEAKLTQHVANNAENDLEITSENEPSSNIVVNGTLADDCVEKKDINTVTCDATSELNASDTKSKELLTTAVKNGSASFEQSDSEGEEKSASETTINSDADDKQPTTQSSNEDHSFETPPSSPTINGHLGGSGISATQHKSLETDVSMNNDSNVNDNDIVTNIEMPQPSVTSSTNSSNFDLSGTNLDMDSSPDANEANSTGDYYFAHVSQKDAFLVFRSLCRLSMKPLSGTNPHDPKSHELRSKILSLQLLLSVLQQPGPAFRSNEIFISAIKQYLCVALSKNGVSAVPEVFELSLAIFLSLLTYFKQHLKMQLEVFFKDILLSILDSPNTTFEHKWIVVEALQRICMDAQCVVDSYINYDCDLDRANIFERLVVGLAKVAQIRNAGDLRAPPAQMQELRKHGLECLVLVLRCMVQWSNDLYNVSTEAQSFLGSEPVVQSHNVDEEYVPSGGVPKATEDDPEAFEFRKAKKEIYETGIALFNNGKTQKSLSLLKQNNLLGSSAEEIAFFFHNESRLSRSAIGDFLGENEAFALEVMYAYVDCFDFSGTEFVCALRLFLSGFRLPGEAQKIDRLMEKFAARYCACNPSNDLFASADTAYVLAYSIIMLTTDLHSSKIKQKQRMSKEDYIRMNRGINDSEDLPRDYLGRIYDEIAQCELQMQTVSTSTSVNGGTTGITASVSVGSVGTATATSDGSIVGSSTSITQRHSRFSSEMAVLAQSARELMESVSHMKSEFTSATHVEHVRPMFKLVWTPFLAAFSVGLQDCDDLRVAHLCLEGIQYAIRIACIFHMELERDAYVQALARFTLLLSTTQTVSSLGVPGSGSFVDLLGNSNITGAVPYMIRTRSDSNNTAGGVSVGIPGSTRGLSGLMAQQITASTQGSGGLFPIAEAGSSLTGSGGGVSAGELMKSKNVDCIRALISVAQSDGNYLGHSWLDILRCISQLESAHIIATTISGLTAKGSTSAASAAARQRVVSDSSPEAVSQLSAQATTNPDISTSSPQQHQQVSRDIISNRMTPGSLAAATVDSRKAAVLQEVMGETGSRSVVVAVDKIFSGSIRLDGDAIEDFVKALCQVSLEELALPHPRTFSLQKVVEISYYNMGRIRLQWSRVWEHIGNHFTTAGRSPNEDVAVFAVDSLRQLSVKLIEKGELPNFHFQKEFLRPFLNILDEIPNVSANIQDMVIRCVAQLIQSQWTNIRSGWTNIFLVLYLAASSNEEVVVNLAFDSCNFVINTVFPNHFYLLVESFPVFIKTLAEFACNLRFPDTSMEAIRLIRSCARTVSLRGTLFLSPPVPLLEASTFAAVEPVPSNDSPTTVAMAVLPIATTTDVESCDQIWRRGWVPIFYELFRVINTCKLDVRTRGLTVFFELIKTYGSSFRLLWWTQIFKLIFSIFEHGRESAGTSSPASIQQSTTEARRRLFSGSELEVPAVSHRVFASAADRSEWLNTTCNHTLYSVVDIFTQFFIQIGETLLPDLYEQLKWCCLQDHEQLARSGTSCFETVILTTGNSFDEDKWTKTVNLLVELFQATVPHELLTWRPDPQIEGVASSKESSSPTVTKKLAARSRLFLRLLISCIVQYELIQTVDNMLFYSSHSRHEDAMIVATARAMSASVNRNLMLLQQNSKAGSEDRRIPVVAGEKSPPSSGAKQGPSFFPVDLEELSNGELPMNQRATYPSVSVEHRLILTKCLLDSHAFAKTFNSNLEQRNILWEAGFKAKAKPNLLKQETHSLSTALRILFRLGDENTDAQERVDSLLEETVVVAIDYYRSLTVDGHRQAWDSCLLLILMRLVHLHSDDRFTRMRNRLYTGLCDLIALPNLSPEVSVLLRAFMLRAGGSKVTAAT